MAIQLFPAISPISIITLRCALAGIPVKEIEFAATARVEEATSDIPVGTQATFPAESLESTVEEAVLAILVNNLVVVAFVTVRVVMSATVVVAEVKECSPVQV